MSLCLFIRPFTKLLDYFSLLHPLFICWQTQTFLPVFSLLISLSPFVDCLSFLHFVPHIIVPLRCVSYPPKGVLSKISRRIRLAQESRFILVILDFNGGLKQRFDLPTRGRKIIGINKWWFLLNHTWPISIFLLYVVKMVLEHCQYSNPWTYVIESLY